MNIPSCTIGSLALLLLLALPECPAAQQRIEAGRNDTIVLEDFTLRFTEPCLSKKVEWSIMEKNTMLSEVMIQGMRSYNILTGRPPFLFTMQFKLTPLLLPANIALPREVLADTMRAAELRSIEEEVKSQEGFSLVSSNSYTELVNGRNFYVLAFVIKKKGGFFTTSKKGESFAQVSWMYLYIPRDTGNEYVIAGMYWETMPKDWYTKGYNPQFLDCFKEVLGGMEMRE
jgi:hypothetical protein